MSLKPKPLSSAGPPVDYDGLLARYRSALVDRLRSFGPAEEYLELWVPDEDPVQSLVNLVDAAGAVGREAVSVFIGAETRDLLDVAALRKAAGAFGTVGIEPSGNGLLFSVTDLRDGAPAVRKPRATAGTRREPPGRGERGEGGPPVRPTGPLETEPVAKIGPLYARALAGVEVVRDRELGDGSGSVSVEAASGNVTLGLHVDPATHVIRRARHAGGKTQLERALLEKFCVLIEGWPLQEAGDHGVTRLERELRGTHRGRPVPGIVTPLAADPAFALPMRLIRRALAGYREKTGYADIVNEFDPGPSPEWRALGDVERRRRLAAALGELALEHGFAPGDVEVLAIEFDVRVVVRLRGALAADKPRHLMALESGIKAKVDDRLELYQEELKDSNMIRRLSEAGEGQ